MANLRLTLACGPYDRTQALRDGTLRPEGIDLTYVTLQPAEIFWRMLQYKEFDVSEMSLSNFTTLVSSGAAPFVAIPVFPSRVFRHGYFFINTTKGIEKPSDLKGKRGGVPEYSMTAAVYMRGLLEHDYGVKPSDIAWVQPMIEEEQAIIGRDWYPYGIEQNRPTIEALLQYTHEQGLTERRIRIEELFAPSTLRDIPLGDGQLV